MKWKKINKIKELEEVGKELGRLEIKLLKEELEEFEIKIPKIETEKNNRSIKTDRKSSYKNRRNKKVRIRVEKTKKKKK